jgi:DNA sulfur modification protein DndC
LLYRDGKVLRIKQFLETKEKIEKEYLADSRPFVITYSGGKDSTVVLHIFLEVILELRSKGIQLRKSYIVSSDTKVELPIINSFLESNIEELQQFVKKESLPIEVVLIKPDLKNSFFSLMIGKGYPPPNRVFRWCTDRLKIRPTKLFFEDLTSTHKSIIMLLGVRRDESINRQKSIDFRERNYRSLSPHDVIPNAFILSPISDWTTDEVWQFLRTNKPQWRDSYSELLNIYAKGSGDEECNLSFDTESPSCGNSRFGCWTCSVVAEDRSMKGMIESGEAFLKPLYNYRSYLMEIREDSEKRSSRRKNGMTGMGDFLMEIRFELLEKLLQAEKEIGYELISKDEIYQIQEFWNNDGNIDNRALKIANSYRKNSFKLPEEKFDLNGFDLNKELFYRVYEEEKQAKVSGIRRGITAKIENRFNNHFKRIFSENHRD